MCAARYQDSGTDAGTCRAADAAAAVRVIAGAAIAWSLRPKRAARTVRRPRGPRARVHVSQEGRQVTRPVDFNAKVIEEFRTNGGRVGGVFEGQPLLLLHHTGARSGAARVNPLAYLADNGRYVIFASKAGAPTNPDWYHNLRAHPETSIEVGDATLAVVAGEAEGAERSRLFEAQVAAMPQFGEYARKTTREIPVVVLTPR